MTGTVVLRSEHHEIKIMLAVCGISAGRIKNGHLNELDTIAGAVEFFKDFIDGCHHKKEEDILFPLLEAKGLSGGQDASVAALLDEHVQGRKLVQLINQNLAGVQRGSGNTALLAESIMDYAALLEKHMRKEDNELFARAEAILTPEEQQRLYEEFEWLEKEEIGAGVHEKFHHLVHEMANRYKIKG